MSFFTPNSDCGCVDCDCPVIECIVEDGELTYTISNAASATLRTYNDGQLISTEDIDPPNGTVTQSSPGGYTYFIDAVGENGCLVSSPCSDPTCTCGVFIGYVPIDVVDGATAWATGSGTYYATLYKITGVGEGCYFRILDGEGNQFEKFYFVGGGVARIRFAGIHPTFFSITNALGTLCSVDTTYTYSIAGNTITFTVRAT